MTRTQQATTVSETMSHYEARISQSDDEYYALIVHIDRDGEESVIQGYRGRYFKTRLAAERSTSKYIAKI